MSTQSGAEKNKMNYQELTQEEILCWYDGPLIETLRDTDGNVYIAYNDPDDEILSKVSNELLIKMIKNQISISECFRAGSNKWKWDTEKRDYVEIPEFNPDDLLDDKVHFEDVCYFEHDKNYLNTLENKELYEQHRKT